MRSRDPVMGSHMACFWILWAQFLRYLRINLGPFLGGGAIPNKTAGQPNKIRPGPLAPRPLAPKKPHKNEKRPAHCCTGRFEEFSC